MKLSASRTSRPSEAAWWESYKRLKGCLREYIMVPMKFMSDRALNDPHHRGERVSSTGLTRAS